MQFRLFVTLTILLMSSGCTTLPKPKSFDDKGCGIHQFDDTWIARNGIRISWTGACKSGLMEGYGQLTVVNSSGKIIATYKGWMKGGYYNTSYADGGKLIDKGMALLVDGDFRYEGKFTWGKISQGKKFAKGVLVYDGHFVEGKYMIGKLYLTNGGRLDGYFDSNAVSYGADGRGVIDAKYIQPNGSIGYWIVDQKIYRTEKESRAANLKMNSDKMIALRRDAQVAQENYENVYKKALGSVGSIALVAADEYLAHNKAANPPSHVVSASPTPTSTGSIHEGNSNVTAAGGVSQGLRLTPQGTTLQPPKGYEHIKPAQLYSISMNALGDPRWIVARSKTEAIQIGKRFYGWYDRFNDCLPNGCEGANPIAFDFGWVAIIQAFRPGDPNIRSRDTRKFGVYGVYAAGSRQAAINGALADYRAKRGSDGPIAQSIRVGLVSEINWPRVEAEFKESAVRNYGLIPNMDELNYKTFCNWGDESTNMNPEPTTGDLDHDPKCKTLYRPDEKLPPPILMTK